MIEGLRRQAIRAALAEREGILQAMASLVVRDSDGERRFGVIELDVLPDASGWRVP